MNPLLTKIIRATALLAAGAAGSLALAAEVDTVQSPNKRQETVEMAKKLLAPREIPVVKADPFHPGAFSDTSSGHTRPEGTTTPATGESTPQPTGPRSDHDLLQAIALSLKPSGYILLGGQPSLSFGQKRVKPGGFLTITFEGIEYTLEIKTIDRTHFTLRLNREEFTRPIK